MNIKCKDFQTDGQISILQFLTLNWELWDFYPGGPAVEKGDLIIKELGEEGRVEDLQAINNTNNYLFFMDTDILIGAKQNRVLNTSVLFAPKSHTVMSVSCVERGRWRSSSPKFKMGDHHIESEIRRQKAVIIKPDPKERRASARRFQSEVWNRVACKCTDARIDNPTEDYDKILSIRAEHKASRLKGFTLDEKANGLAVLTGKEIVSVDVFGSQPVYEYYFPRLIENIEVNLADDQKSELTVEEAVDLVGDYLSKQNSIRSEFYPAKSGIGKIRQFEEKKITGSELVFEDRGVHMFILSQKKVW